MATIEDRFTRNAPGKFYVDAQCIDCDLCRERLPHIFHRDNEGGHSFVAKQPESGSDLIEAMIALDDCPAEAIGNDGTEI